MQTVEFDEIDSTNLEAKRMAEAGAFGPLWISAKRQTAGAGRRGREWVSNTGNLFCTGLFPYVGEAASAARLSFAAALAVAETLDQYIPPEKTKIKWPNDVMVDGQKISGILLESGTTDGQFWIAVGIGINLISAPDKVETPATNISQHFQDAEISAQAVLKILIERFEHWRGTYSNAGFEPLRTAWLARAQGIGKPVKARLPNKTIDGIATDLDTDGALCVKTRSGQHIKIHAGDVFFL